MKKFFSPILLILVIILLAFTSCDGSLVETLFTEDAPPAPTFADKVLSVQRLYTVGEAALTSDDIITINGVECYVLEVSGTKAKLITKDMYDVRFEETNNMAYEYDDCSIKDWMETFYTNDLGADSRILTTTVTNYYKNWDDDNPTLDLSVYSHEDYTVHAFPLEAEDVIQYANKFSWHYEDGVSPSYMAQMWTIFTCFDNYGFSFWAGCTFGIMSDGTINSVWPEVTADYAGARPIFWVTLE